MADDRAQARREAAQLLGVDIEHLSPADNLRVDMVSSLRLVIDAEQAAVLSGNQADLGKLNVAVASLIALLPGQKLAEPVPVDGGPSDPRQIMLRTYMEMRRRGALAGEGLDGAKLRIERLTAELAAKDAEIASLRAGAPDESSASSGTNATAADNVVPMPRTPSVPPKPAPPAPATGLITDSADDEPWRAFCTDVDGVPLSGRGGKYWGPV
jgi:hypothetical protein